MKISFLLSIGSLALLSTACSHHGKIKAEPTVSSDIPVKAHTAPIEAKTSLKKVSGDTHLTCVMGTDSRTITLQKGDKRCEVHYTKSGTLNNIAWGEKTPAICDRVFDNVRTNIETGGFKCNGESQKTASN